jgi:hypothetical protein
MAVVVAALFAIIMFANRPHSIVLIENGRIEQRRGALPGELIRDLKDIARRLRPSGRVEIRGEGEQLSVKLLGFEPQAAQRVRNVVWLQRNHIRRPR